MARSVVRRLLALASVFLVGAAFTFAVNAQTVTGLHGLVKDSSGAVVPKAGLQLLDMATNVARQTTSGEDGSFTFTNLPAGSFKLTATAPGFQSSVLESIVVDTGRTTDVAIQLNVGATTESVQVQATAAQLETTSNEVGNTINVKSISDLPYTSRDALNFSLLTAGATSTSGNSTFNGLPNASMNITLDGMNNNSQRFKSGGTSFYSFAPQRLDAIEEVTVSTSGMNADQSGQGAMNLRFTTKRGTDKYHFHVLEQFANEDLNANSWFNNARGIARSRSRTADYAGNMGGPLLPWIHPLKGKVFFFVNFEDVPAPGTSIVSRTVPTDAALAGNYTYLGTDGQNHTVNLLNLAAANGFSGALNATTQKLAQQLVGTRTNPQVIGFIPVTGTPYETNMQWNLPGENTNLYPTARLDVHLTSKLNYYTSWNLYRWNIIGEPYYPGAPVPSWNTNNNASYLSTRYVWTHGVDYTITPHLLNNFNFGIQSNNEYYNKPADPRMWANYGYGGQIVTLPIFSQGTLIYTGLPDGRNNPVWQANDTVTWVHGSHTMTMGAAFMNSSFFEIAYGGAGVPNISLGVTTNDPVNSIFTTTNLPFINSSNSDIANAKALYAMLTGRISGYTANESVDEKTHQYQAFAPGTQRFLHRNLGVFFADTWRISPNLTLNYGLRWEFDSPTHSTNGVDAAESSLYGPSTIQFAPGVLGGDMNPQLNIKNVVYQNDYVNPAPNIGLTWNPKPDQGLAAKLLGHDKSVFSIAYRISYYDEGMNAISNLQSGSPGATQTVTASSALAANPGAYSVGGAAPALSTTPSCFCFPIPVSNYVLNGGLTWQYVNPNLKMPYVQDWNVRYQREIVRGTVISVSYVGNKGTHVYHYQNVNETNTLENGFISEFKNAQNNLAIANGLTVAQMTAQPYVSLKTQNFANQGLPGQVPLPIFQTAFGANGSNAALAASSGFGNTGFVTNLQQGQVGNLATSLASTSANTYYCRLVGANFAPCAAQGFTAVTSYAMNFFRANPYANTVNYQDDNANSNYNALQIDVRHAFSHGLVLAGNYVWSHTLGTVNNLNDQTATTTWTTLRNGRLSYGPTPFDHRNVVNIYGSYDLPIGKGRLVNLNNRALNAAIGGWTIGTVNTIASGSPINLTGGRLTFNAYGTTPTGADGGVVFGNNTNITSLLNATSTQVGGFDKSCTCIRTNVSSLTLSNGVVSPAVLAAAQTPGVIGSPVWYTGKTSFTFNLSVTKNIRFTERVNMRLYAEASNWLNHPFFGQGSLSLTSSSFGNITSASGTRSMILRWSLDF
jgi:hypothetical protein